MGETAVDVRDVSISYRIMNDFSIRTSLFKKRQRNEVFEAVKHVSFSVDKGGILGIIGKNGSGKSTLLRSIAGVFAPNSGTIDLHGNTVSLMALGVGFKENLTGRENIVLSGMLQGIDEKEIIKRTPEIIEFAEIGDFIDRPVRTYSNGMYSKLAFAITVTLQSDIILIDEVLSVGDEGFKKKSLAKMKEIISDQNRTVIIVSHDMKTMQGLCDNMLWIHAGEVMEYGKPDEVMAHYKKYNYNLSK
jgi:ABC-type polysaccharide/polyol phosphate transport system ATPase subunit